MDILRRLNRLRSLDLYDKLFILLFVIIAFFSFNGLGRASINNDAHFWYSRTEEFISEIRDRDWEETLQNPKPGVTVHWLSGLSLEAFLSLYEWKYGFRPSIWTYDTFPLVHTAAVGPLVLVSLCFILTFYLIVARLFSKKIAFYSTLLFGLQPFYIGLSRNFHADSTVTAFMGISALLLLYFLHTFRRKWLIFSGVSAGLALLTKSSAVYLLPYCALCLIVNFLFSKEDARPLFYYVKAGFLWLLIAALVFFLLLPDMWVEPLTNLRLIFLEEGLFLARVGRDGADASETFMSGFWEYLEPLWRDLTPVLLGAALGGLIIIVFGFKTLRQRLLLVLTAFYPLFYFIQMSLAAQKMDRYLLPLVPFLGFLGGIFLADFETVFSRKLKKKYFILASFVLNLTFVLYYFPNYLIYPSIKGKDQFGCSLCSDVGAYLNSKPDSADLKIIITSNKVHRLRPFFKGKIYTTNENLPCGWTPEYVVIAAHESLPEDYSYCSMEKEIQFRGITYWKIFRCK